MRICGHRASSSIRLCELAAAGNRLAEVASFSSSIEEEEATKVGQNEEMDWSRDVKHKAHW